jgi:hypothetical protein
MIFDILPTKMRLSCKEVKGQTLASTLLDRTPRVVACSGVQARIHWNTGDMGVGDCSACAAGTYKAAANSAAGAPGPATRLRYHLRRTSVPVCATPASAAPPTVTMGAADMYKLSSACLACSAHSDSASNASGLASCLCLADFFGMPCCPCQLCKHGSYSD